MAKAKVEKQAAPRQAPPLPVAVQLYSVRALEQPSDELFAAIAAIGYDGVEVAGTYGLAAEALREKLDAHGLSVVSAHVPLAEMEADLPEVVRYHKTLGNDTLIVPWVGPDLRGEDAASWQTLGRRLEQLARRCSYANMRFMYHNHDFEMVEIDGRPAIDWMLEGVDPELVGFEIDVAWVQAGGQNVPAMLARYAGRCSRIHMKDLSESGEGKGLADVGYGILDWDAILPAARQAGVEWLVVEHDEPVDPLASIERSYAFLAEKQATG